MVAEQRHNYNGNFFQIKNKGYAETVAILTQGGH